MRRIFRCGAILSEPSQITQEFEDGSWRNAQVPYNRDLVTVTAESQKNSLLRDRDFTTSEKTCTCGGDSCVFVCCRDDFQESSTAAILQRVSSYRRSLWDRFVTLSSALTRNHWSVGKIRRWAAAGLRQKKRVVREDAMSIRIVFVMLVAAVSMAFGFMPANAQQPQRAQPPQSLRLYVLDCGKIFVKQNHAQLWIQHDYTSGIKRKVAPEF